MKPRKQIILMKLPDEMCPDSGSFFLPQSHTLLSYFWFTSFSFSRKKNVCWAYRLL